MAARGKEIGPFRNSSGFLGEITKRGTPVHACSAACQQIRTRSRVPLNGFRRKLGLLTRIPEWNGRCSYMKDTISALIRVQQAATRSACLFYAISAVRALPSERTNHSLLSDGVFTLRIGLLPGKIFSFVYFITVSKKVNDLCSKVSIYKRNK